MDDHTQCTRSPHPLQSPPHREPTLEDRAEAALQRIGRYGAAFNPAPERRARWLSAAAKLAGAAADFAVLAADGTEDAFLEDAFLGDALLASQAADAVGSVVEAQRTIGSIGYFEFQDQWEDSGTALASGDADGERGQRLLLTIAEKLQARYGL